MRAYARNLGHRAPIDRRPSVSRAALITLIVLLLTGLFSSVAKAGQLSVTSITDTPPSAAAGAKSIYTVGFTGTGGLSNAAGSQILITFPANTDLTGLVGSSVKVPAVSSTSIGNCFRSAATVVTCTLFSGQSIAAGAAVSVEIDGVVNAPTTGSNTLSVATTSPSDTAGSSTFSIVAAQPLSVTSITDTPPSAAAGAKSIYTVGFTTSSTGGLSNAAGSQILITFPANTDLTGLVGSSVADTSISSSAIGNCFRSAATVVTCTLFSGQAIAPSHTVSVVIDGVVNAPSTGTNTISVDTTSDTAGSSTFSIVAAQPLSVTSITDTPPSAAAGAKSIYTVGFTTSSTGGLSNAAGSQILITFPANTDLTGLVGSSVADTSISSSAIGNCFRSAATVVTCTLFSGQAIAPSHTVSVVIDGVVNAPSTGTNTISVDTTSDTAGSSTFSIVAAQPLSVTSITDTPPSAAAGAKSIYTVGFTTSSTGGLSNAAGSQILITFPANTDLTGLVGSSVADTSISSSAIGNCFRSAATVVTCTLFSGQAIAPSHTVSVVIDGVVNAPSTGTNTISVDTTSDTAGSSTFSIVAAQPISQPALQLSNTAAGAGNVAYTIAFTTSSTGGLSNTAGSQITITFPATTDLTHLTGSSVADTSVSSTAIGNCFRSAATVVTCTLFSGQSIGPSQVVNIVVSGVLTRPRVRPPPCRYPPPRTGCRLRLGHRRLRLRHRPVRPPLPRARRPPRAPHRRPCRARSTPTV